MYVENRLLAANELVCFPNITSSNETLGNELNQMLTYFLFKVKM